MGNQFGVNGCDEQIIETPIIETPIIETKTRVEDIPDIGPPTSAKTLRDARDVYVRAHTAVKQFWITAREFPDSDDLKGCTQQDIMQPFRDEMKDRGINITIDEAMYLDYIFFDVPYTRFRSSVCDNPNSEDLTEIWGEHAFTLIHGLLIFYFCD